MDYFVGVDWHLVPKEDVFYVEGSLQLVLKKRLGGNCLRAC